MMNDCPDSREAESAIAILLPVFNGAHFLPALLDSLLGQGHCNWTLLISDDGSTDASLSIVKEFQAQHPERAQVFTGPKAGITANYLFLLAKVDPTASITAFCDQDDIWLPERLERAAQALRTTNAPTLYCSRTVLVDHTVQHIGFSPLRRRGPSFANALCQNIASGNTMALNSQALDLLQRNIAQARDVPFHDWWAYQLIAGAGGEVLYDCKPTLLYRQHADNAVGAGVSLTGLVRRALRTAQEDLSKAVDGQLHALLKSRTELTERNCKCLDRVAKSRKGNPFQRVVGIIGAGLYRQTRFETPLMWMSAALGKF